MYQCLICEDWKHHACVLSTHVDLNESPLGTDEFDQLCCDECVRSNRDGIRTLIERYAGVEGSGVMIVDSGGQVLGHAVFDDEEEEEVGNLESPKPDEVVKAEGEEVSNSLKRTGRSESEERSPKKPKLEEAASSSTEHGNSTSSLPSSAPTPSTSTDPNQCKAPPLPSADTTSPLAKVEREEGKLNVLFEEGWRMRWCRCEKVRMIMGYPH